MIKIIRIVSSLARMCNEITEPERKLAYYWPTGSTETALSILFDLPTAFTSFLDRAYAKYHPKPSDKLWGMGKAYGPYLRPLICSIPADHPCRLAFNQALFNHARGRVTLKGRHWEKVHHDGPQAPVSLGYASRELQLGHDNTVRLAAHLGILDQQPGKGRPAHLLGHHVNLMRSAIRKSISLAETARQLDVGIDAVESLVSYGCLAKLEIDDPTWLPIHGDRPQFKASSLGDLLDRLFNCFVADMSDGLHYLGRVGAVRVSVAKVVDLVLRGDLRIGGIDNCKRGLNRYLVSLRKVRKVTMNPDPDSVCIRDAAVSIGIHYDAMRALAKNGHVPYRTEGRIRRIARTDLDRFLNRYVTLREIAGMLSPARHHNIIHVTLSGLEIKPVFGPPDYRTCLYDREQVLLNIAAINEDI